MIRIASVKIRDKCVHRFPIKTDLLCLNLNGVNAKYLRTDSVIFAVLRLPFVLGFVNFDPLKVLAYCSVYIHEWCSRATARGGHGGM